MKVVKVISDFNDLQIQDMLLYFSELRWFCNIHFCLDLNIIDSGTWKM